jgi:hypothetical protein
MRGRGGGGGGEGLHGWKVFGLDKGRRGEEREEMEKRRWTAKGLATAAIGDGQASSGLRQPIETDAGDQRPYKTHNQRQNYPKQQEVDDCIAGRA